MADFFTEIGDTLDSYLRLFQNSTLSVEDIIAKRAIELDFAREILFALYRRGHIRNLNWKNYDKPEDIDIADVFRISIDGIDYLELHKKWWQRFWFRSVGCPMVVSFVTAINAETIWDFVKIYMRFAIKVDPVWLPVKNCVRFISVLMQ